MYHTSTEAAILAFLAFNEINKLHTIWLTSELDSVPGHLILKDLLFRLILIGLNYWDHNGTNRFWPVVVCLKSTIRSQFTDLPTLPG